MLETSKLRLGCSSARTLLISNGVPGDWCVGRVLHRITVIRICSDIIDGTPSHSLKHENVTYDVRYDNWGKAPINYVYTIGGIKYLLDIRNLLLISPPTLSDSAAIALPPLLRAPPQNSGPITNCCPLSPV